MKVSIIRAAASAAAAIVTLSLLRSIAGTWALYEWGSYHKKLRAGGETI